MTTKIEVGKKYTFPKYQTPIYEILAIHDGMAWCLVVSKGGNKIHQSWKVSLFEDCIEYKEPPKPVEYKCYAIIRLDVDNKPYLDIDRVFYVKRNAELRMEQDFGDIGIVELKGEFVPK